MSKKNPSVIDYFDLNGDLNEEAHEFEEVKLEDYIDKRSSLKPTWIGRYSHQLHFDLANDTEVTFYKCLNIVYSDILFAGGIRTILFKCRQKKNLTRFISRVLELAQGDPSNIHPDFRS